MCIPVVGFPTRFCDTRTERDGPVALAAFASATPREGPFDDIQQPGGLESGHGRGERLTNRGVNVHVFLALGVAVLNHRFAFSYPYSNQIVRWFFGTSFLLLICGFTAHADFLWITPLSQVSPMHPSPLC
jgi:hypothetical protein